PSARKASCQSLVVSRWLAARVPSSSGIAESRKLRAESEFRYAKKRSHFKARDGVGSGLQLHAGNEVREFYDVAGQEKHCLRHLLRRHGKAAGKGRRRG